ncbi:MAG TPA: acyl-[acyl-carrier-protein]--UDP-N-acetylglucosamine O-acyltransferase, partial [bacterium]
MAQKRVKQAATNVTVHPTALVDPRATLGSGVVVEPYAIIEAGAAIGAGTSIGPHCVIKSLVSLGEGNRLSVGVVLGEEPQHRAFVGERSFVRIGHRNIFREYVTVNRAYGEDAATEIGDDN